MKDTLRILRCWLFSLFLVLPVLAQDAPSFSEIVDVRVINIEVVVTDGGERVNDLSSDDFRLLVDGTEVPIEYFTEVSEGLAVSSESRSESGTVPALRPGESVGTRYLVFIDDSFSIQPRRNRVLDGLIDELHHLGPEDHMAVVAFDGRRIDMLSSWTASRDELVRVFEGARKRPANGLLHNRRERVEDELLRARFGYTPRGSMRFRELSNVTDAVTSVLRGFAKPPGRKVMLLLSGGWPTSIQPGFGSQTDLYTDWGTEQHLFKPIIDTANRLGYTLYPVDVQGLDRRSPGSAEFGTAAEAQAAADFDREREWSEEGNLVYLATQTGGRALLDGASMNALKKTADDTRSYYWLGFAPTWREDDRRHRIKVEVRDKGLRVRSRRNFSDLSRRTEMTMLVESAQLFGLPMPGEGESVVSTLGVDFGEPQGKGRKLLVPVKVEIPLDEITLLPEQDGFHGQVELRVAVTDDRGDRADIPVIPIPLHRTSAGEGETVVFDFSLRMRRRPHDILFSVFDTTSGSMISKRVQYSP